MSIKFGMGSASPRLLKSRTSCTRISFVLFRYNGERGRSILSARSKTVSNLVFVRLPVTNLVRRASPALPHASGRKTAEVRPPGDKNSRLQCLAAADCDFVAFSTRQLRTQDYKG